MEEFKELSLIEYIDTAKVKLRREDLKCKKDVQEINNLKEKYPKIRSILEDNEITDLTKDECKILHHILSLYDNIYEKQEEKIFFLGCKQAYFYFKNIGIIQ